ncbi:sacsin N-terminal ATP-binding-like domain-containing protein, partial [Endozoicomonas sp. ONNA2]|uniref:sacsin N-terminal ATP-binding-like domain-containing protein n=1 Tax=Endozoicomonas sp. ONNA2 TaxID=2828741 RepID=UPI0021492504
MAGAEQDPISVINQIRDNLRDRYENGFPVLKEIIQNSDDATADKLVMGWCQGVENPDNPLLRDPAIFFINNAPLKEEHEKGIRSIAAGSKADSKASVGKFGLGMKSLFHLCEAFFYQSDQWQEFGWAAEVFNPWGEEYRPDWHEYSKSDQAKIFQKLSRVIQRFAVTKDSPWFIVWVPLRTHQQIPAGEGSIAGIFEDDGDVPEFLLDKNLPGKIAEIFPLLKQLKQVELLIENKTDSFESIFTIQIGNKSERSRFIGDAILSDASVKAGWAGEVCINHSGSDSRIQYAGVERILQSDKLAEIKRKENGWPCSFQKDIKTGKVKHAPDKAEPHVAIVITRTPAKDQAHITANWAVFLPLSETPEFKRENIPGDFNYHIYLHGHFFVDAGRNGIHGHDAIGKDADSPWREGDEKALLRAWNQALANEGTPGGCPRIDCPAAVAANWS